MTLETRADGSPIGYRRILKARVHELRARIDRENSAMFSAGLRARRETVERLHVHVKTMVEEEFRASRLRAARADQATREREVDARRELVDQELTEETARRLEAAARGLEDRRELLAETRRETVARADETRARLDESERDRLARARREHDARARAFSQLIDGVSALRRETRDELDAYARLHLERARDDLHARLRFLDVNHRFVEDHRAWARAIVRELDAETRATCASTRRAREHELRELYSWVYNFTGRRIRSTL